MGVIDDFIKSNFYSLIQKYDLIVETFEGDLFSHIYNFHVHIFVRTEMYNRDKYNLTVKVIKNSSAYIFSRFTLYHYAGLEVPTDCNYKNGFDANIKLLDNHYHWLLTGNFECFESLVHYDNKIQLLFREQHGDRAFYKNKKISDDNKTVWVTEMEHWVRHKYNLMLDMYQQEANNGNVLAYFPLKDFDKIKPLLVEQLFINKWDNPTWDVYWGSTDYSWVKRLAEKAGF